MTTQNSPKNFLKLNKQGIINGFNAFKKHMWRTGPSEEHKLAWAAYDYLLMIRANAGQLVVCIQFIGFLVFGTTPY